jgi:pimeloyl-ACP methyl ester carboxylesterase
VLSGRVLAAAGAALAVTGAVALSARRGDKAPPWPPRPGRRVDVAGCGIHVIDRGSGARGTVVFESALAAPCTEWAWVAEYLGDDVRSIAYDRAGTGWSDPIGRAPDAETTVERLAAVLTELGVDGPVVMVGHSVGGLLARSFTARYPARVSGVVLVDASHPDQLARSSAQRDSAPLQTHSLAAMRRRARLGQVTPETDFGAVDQLPPQTADITARLMCRPEPWTGALAEVRAWHPGWATAARDAHLPSDLPIAVVTAGEQVRRDRVHGVLQEELATLSTRARHDTAAGLTHDGVVMTPAGATIVAGAVEWVLARAAGEEEPA